MCVCVAWYLTVSKKKNSFKLPTCVCVCVCICDNNNNPCVCVHVCVQYTCVVNLCMCVCTPVCVCISKIFAALLQAFFEEKNPWYHITPPCVNIRTFTFSYTVCDEGTLSCVCLQLINISHVFLSGNLSWKIPVLWHRNPVFIMTRGSRHTAD